ncbi:DUF2798 domain-containing protein [Pararhodobacter zhoushanensis]|uniref:DUF2798 domain-containing protein n=1 Tax=Pararhodobacter zhoushanensis TaxID=2479545 RepID=A0ABT3GTF2_9RHOB|nr:DUF2798 domain-containing protein [Pararhodobacter zhoushanensis]MCW1930818.1 DUF2798 domain-containing protein [Pararhodobacter zhoushanensis]
MQSRKVILLAQVFISGLMAFSMSGIMGFLHTGNAPDFIKIWLSAFITAWPIAFVLSLGVSPLAFWMAGRLAKPRHRAQG